MTKLAAKKNKPTLNSAFKRLMDIHWFMSGFYLILFVTGSFMAHLQTNEFTFALYDFHKSIGVLVVALLTWRIVVLLQVWWKKYTKRFPKMTPQWWKTMILHTSLYLWMWVLPTTGFFLSNSYQVNNVKFFGILLPDLFPHNSALFDIARSSHFWTSYIFLAFIVLHIIAQWKIVKALWRRFYNFLYVNLKKS